MVQGLFCMVPGFSPHWKILLFETQIYGMKCVQWGYCKLFFQWGFITPVFTLSLQRPEESRLRTISCCSTQNKFKKTREGHYQTIQIIRNCIAFTFLLRSDIADAVPEILSECLLHRSQALIWQGCRCEKVQSTPQGLRGVWQNRNGANGFHTCPFQYAHMCKCFCVQSNLQENMIPAGALTCYNISQISKSR